MKAPHQEISASEFKKHCLHLLQEVKITGKTIIVTKRSTPLDNNSNQNKKSYFGFLHNTVTINADIVNFSTQDEWKINNDQPGN